MGFSSQLAQDRQHEQDIIDRLSEIEDSFADENRAIINIIQSQGFSALSKEQREVFENDIEPELNSRFVACAGCSQLFDKGMKNIDNEDDLYYCSNCQ